jgi:hypothetical protein
VLGGHISDALFADGMVEYSLLYLSNNVHDVGLKPPYQNLVRYATPGGLIEIMR